MSKLIDPITCNGKVACRPLQASVSSQSAFSDWQSKNQCIELDVIFGTSKDEYMTGDKIYVRPFIDSPVFLNEIFTLHGKEVVLVPFEMVVAYRSFTEY